MSKKRMFSKQITESDAFLDMPLSTQALYLHLAMNADDDGFINAPKRIQRMIGASDDDLKLLIIKSFIIEFESGVMVVKHWRLNNYIRSDRYTPTVYTEERGLLIEKKNRVYSLKNAQGIPNDYQSDTQYRLDKNRLNKSSCLEDVKILQQMTENEIEYLFEKYEDADRLIDAVEDEINTKKKGNQIDDFFRYTIGCARNWGWDVIEQD